MIHTFVYLLGKQVAFYPIYSLDHNGFRLAFACVSRAVVLVGESVSDALFALAAQGRGTRQPRR